MQSRCNPRLFVDRSREKFWPEAKIDKDNIYSKVLLMCIPELQKSDCFVQRRCPLSLLRPMNASVIYKLTYNGSASTFPACCYVHRINYVNSCLFKSLIERKQHTLFSQRWKKDKFTSIIWLEAAFLLCVLNLGESWPLENDYVTPASSIHFHQVTRSIAQASAGNSFILKMRECALCGG